MRGTETAAAGEGDSWGVSVVGKGGSDLSDKSARLVLYARKCVRFR